MKKTLIQNPHFRGLTILSGGGGIGIKRLGKHDAAKAVRHCWPSQ
jgi:hypothetical protein